MKLRLVSYDPGDLVERCFRCELDCNEGDLVVTGDEEGMFHADCSKPKGDMQTDGICSRPVKDFEGFIDWLFSKGIRLALDDYDGETYYMDTESAKNRCSEYVKSTGMAECPDA